MPAAPRPGFDHRPEGVAAQGPLLLKVAADFRELFRRQHFIQDLAPCLVAFGWGAAEAAPGRANTLEQRQARMA